MPFGGLLVGIGDFEDGLFAEGLADNLHADGQPIGKAGGDGNPGEAGNIYGQGANVTEIHLERVVHLLANLKGDGGGGGGYQGITLFKSLVKFPPYQGADFLGFEVIGIIVTGG